MHGPLNMELIITRFYESEHGGVGAIYEIVLVSIKTHTDAR